MQNDNVYKMSEADERKKKTLMIMYCLTFFGNGIYNSFFSTYEAMLETDVYMLPIMLVGIIEVLSQVVKWVFSPVLGAFMDRFKFKKGKFWPWMYIGITIMLVSHVTVFALPALVENVHTASTIILFFVLQCCTSLAAPMYTTSVNAVYPKISLDPNDRSTMAMGQKIGRDSSKTIFGMVIPVLIVFLTNKLGSSANAYACMAVCLGSVAFLPYLSLATSLRNSYVEKKAADETENKVKMEKITLKMMFQAIFGNRVLLTIFSFLVVHKGYYFLIQLTSTYLFKYYFEAFPYYGFFTSAYNFAAVGGVIVGVIYKKKLGSIKKAFVTSGIAHVLTLGLIAIFFKNLTWVTFVIMIGVAQFFEGMCEAYYLPMFGIAADYGAYKTGKRQDALIMSTYTMSISIGMNVSTLLRTSLLSSVNYNAADYAAGIKPTQEVLNMLANMNSLIPCIMAAICVLIIVFGFNLTDKQQEEIAMQVKDLV